MRHMPVHSDCCLQRPSGVRRHTTPQTSTYSSGHTGAGAAGAPATASGSLGSGSLGRRGRGTGEGAGVGTEAGPHRSSTPQPCLWGPNPIACRRLGPRLSWDRRRGLPGTCPCRCRAYSRGRTRKARPHRSAAPVRSAGGSPVFTRLSCAGDQSSTARPWMASTAGLSRGRGGGDTGVTARNKHAHVLMVPPLEIPAPPQLSWTAKTSFFGLSRDNTAHHWSCPSCPKGLQLKSASERAPIVTPVLVQGVYPQRHKGKPEYKPGTIRLPSHFVHVRWAHNWCRWNCELLSSTARRTRRMFLQCALLMHWLMPQRPCLPCSGALKAAQNVLPATDGAHLPTTSTTAAAQEGAQQYLCLGSFLLRSPSLGVHVMALVVSD